MSNSDGQGVADKDIYRLAESLLLNEGKYSVTTEMLEKYREYGYTDADLEKVYELVVTAEVRLTRKISELQFS